MFSNVDQCYERFKEIKRLFNSICSKLKHSQTFKIKNIVDLLVQSHISYELQLEAAEGVIDSLNKSGLIPQFCHQCFTLTVIEEVAREVSLLTPPRKNIAAAFSHSCFLIELS